MCVSTLRQDGTELHVDAHGQHSQKCVCPLCVKAAQNCTSTLTVNTRRSVCVHSASRRHRIARRRSRSTLAEVCVSTLRQGGTELHVDAHGQHSQKCVCPLCVKTAQNCTSTLTVNTRRSVCVHSASRRHRIARRRSRSTLAEVCVSTLRQDGTELHVDAHGQHSQKCVCPLWVNTARNCTLTLTVNTPRSVCAYLGQDGMKTAGSTHKAYGIQARQCHITGGFKQS